MERKYLKIFSGCLGLIALAPLTACSTTQKQDEKETQKLDSIELVTEFKDIKIEVDDTYTSTQIEVKCYDKDKKEMKANTELFLFPVLGNDVDISIENNVLRIGKEKKVGKYSYKVVAYNEDATIFSEVKDFNVEVYKSATLPDSIEIKGIENTRLYIPSSKPIYYDLIAKKDGSVIEEYDPTCNLEVNIINSTTGLDKDTFGNPLFSFKQVDKKLELYVSINIDKTYHGVYNLELKASLASTPDISFTKKLCLDLYYALEYNDVNTNYTYARESSESDWCLKSIPSTSVQIEKSRVLNDISDTSVSMIDSNFCTTSGIKKLLVVDIPKNIKIIGDYAFYKQEALTSLYLENVLAVGESAFEGCSLAVINPNWNLNLKYVGKNAFNGCKAFNPKNLKYIVYLGESCFRGIKSTQLYFGPDLSVICNEALYDCPNLKDIYISCTKPPYLMGDFIGGLTPIGYKIHVPSSAIDSYRNDPNWSIYSQNLVGDITM